MLKLLNRCHGIGMVYSFVLKPHMFYLDLCGWGINPGLNFNLGSSFFCLKVFSWINFSWLFRASNHQKARRIKLNLLFKLSYLNSNLALTLGYLKPALNNPAHLENGFKTVRFRCPDSLGSCGRKSDSCKKRLRFLTYLDFSGRNPI